MSLLVAEYCEKLDSLVAAREKGSVPPQVEDLIEDELTELWKQLTVDEVKAVEERYPAMKLEVL